MKRYYFRYRIACYDIREASVLAKNQTEAKAKLLDMDIENEIIVTEYAGIYHPTHIKLHKVETQEKQ